MRDTVSGLNDSLKSVSCDLLARLVLLHSLPLVKPDATAEEVTAVVESDQGTGGQVFAQAVRVTSPHTSC